MGDSAVANGAPLVDVELAPLSGVVVATSPNNQTNASTTPPPPAANNGGGGEGTVTPDGYLDLLRKLRVAWTEQPDVSITWQDLAYTVQVPKADTTVPNLASALFNMVKRPFEGNRNSTVLKALEPCSGVIKPGTMTLILAPPGHGKTTFLKALSGRLEHDKALTGKVQYNGRNVAENKANGVFVNRLCAFVGQMDLHFPALTVGETLTFAAQNSIPDSTLLRDSTNSAEKAAVVEEVIELEKHRADLLIGMLGLHECTDTIVGNDLMRGVSGGQRKRVTVGEMLLTNSRCFMLDEITTGLDAAVTLHIFAALKQACAINNASVVTALLQPTPETYGLFDQIILMRDGKTVYHGPRDDVQKWLWEVAGLEVPPGVDEAGFIVDFLTDPWTQYDAALHNLEVRAEQKAQQTVGLAENSGLAKTSALASSTAMPARGEDSGNGQQNRVVFHIDAGEVPAAQQVAAVAPKPEQIKQLRGATSSVGESMYHSQAQASPVYSSDDLFKRYQGSMWYGQMQTDVSLSLSEVKNLDSTSWGPYTRAQYAQHFPLSIAAHTKLNMSRQVKLMARNRTMIPPRIAQAVIMGFIVGTLFFQLADDKYSDKMGLLLYITMFGAFSNLTELPVASEARNVVAKQIDAGFFPSLAYTISVNLTHIPLVITEVCIIGSMVYFIPGLTYDAGRFFFFLLTCFINSSALSTFFRSISYMAKNPDIARQLDMPFIVIFVIFGGFLITYDKIPNWLIELFYISPFSWAVQSLALNEFGASKYDTLSDGERLGDVYIDQFGLRTKQIWKWMGIVYLAGFYMCFTCFNAYLLSKQKPITPDGTRKSPSAHPKLEAGAVAVVPDAEGAAELAGSPSPVPLGGELVAVQPAKNLRSSRQSFQLTALPFIPVTLTWRNINYSVEIGVGKEKHTRMLLNDISGFAAPGRMTALMGSSGAGKTTLMDVVAGRKTTGVIEGEILVNGFPKEKASFDKLSAYVEQNDIHIGTATVREALLFSAHLRLPITVTEEAREIFVDEVMALVGLTNIAGRLIGDVALPGLSPGQLKLVTIGVELVANPSVIFLDEPTSGLDAPSAARVMKAVRRIAATGRTVLCTIHQPSEQLFLMFDRLLLLKSGGRDVFFSDCGHKGNNLVNYFEAASGYTEKLPRGSKEVLPNGKIKVHLKINPANWMLDVIGAAGNKVGQADYAELWRQSDLYKDALADIASAAEPKPNSKPIVLNETYASGATRFWAVQHRLVISHWRNAPMNLTRAILMLIIGILLGVIYFDMSTDDFGGVTSKLSVVFLGLSFPSSVAANSPLPSLFRTRAVYYRELTIGLYGYKIFNATIFFIELPFIFCSVLIFLIPFYFMINFEHSFVLFARFFLMNLLVALTYSSLCSCWLALLPNQIALNVVNGLFMSLFFIFGGLLIKPTSMPAGWKWFYHVNPIAKAFNAVALGQFYCNVDERTDCPSITPSPGQPKVAIYTYLAELLDAKEGDYGQYVGWLVLGIVILRILNLVALKYVSHIKR